MANVNDRLDKARGHVLDRMEAGQRLINVATGAAGLLELVMLVACILLVDWSDRTQVLLFVIFILSYFILVLCMLALAGHVSRSTARVLAVLEVQQRSGAERIGSAFRIRISAACCAGAERRSASTGSDFARSSAGALPPCLHDSWRR